MADLADIETVSLLDGYASKPYQQYLSLFDAWCNQSVMLLHKNSDLWVLSLDALKQNTFVIHAKGRGGRRTTVQLPSYESIADQIRRLKQEYQYIYMHRLAVATSQEDIKTIVEQLATLHTQILGLHWYVHLARSPQQTEHEELKELQDRIKGLSDDAFMQKKAILKMARWLKKHASERSRAQALTHKLAPTALLRSPPDIQVTDPRNGDGDGDGTSNSNMPGKKKTKKRDSKKEPRSNKEKIEHVKDKVLQLVIHHAFPLNKFKFTRHDQCVETFSKSKAYTISKTEFIETIEKDEDLKKLFPKNFKSLSKEQLCAILFKTSKVHGA